MRLYTFLFLIFLLSCRTKQSADLLVYNAHIYTIDSLFSIADAMAVKDGKIIATGKWDAIQNEFETKDSLNAHGRFIYPGFIDAHCHFLAYGKGLQECDLVGTTSWTEVLKKLKSFATTHPEGWLIGRGWDQNDWSSKQYPVNDSLNLLFPGRPVLLGRVDGHAAIANEKALQLAGVQPRQKITGGEIISQNGVLSGLLIDNAVELVRKNIPKPTPVELTKHLQDAARNCFAVGLTSVQDCGLDATIIPLLQELYKTGKLAMRMYVMLSDKKENYDYLFANGKIQTNELTVCGFKLYADGALGSRGACLLHPYSDVPAHHGFLLKSKSYYDSILPVIASKGFQACTHAIGDSANRTILGLMDKNVPKNG